MKPVCFVTRTKYYCVVLYLYRKIVSGRETHSLCHTVYFEKNGYHMRGEEGQREAERTQKTGINPASLIHCNTVQ